MGRALIAWAVALALSANQAVAQEAPPLFSSDTQVVVLDIVASDRKGKLADDLKPEEVRVFEDGKPCEVLSFRLIRARVDAAAQDGMTAPASPAPRATPGAATPTRASLVVLVFDRLSTTTAPLARRGALDLLKRSFPPDTWFAVFKVGYGITLLEPFTTDAQRLQGAIDLATSGDRDLRVGPLAPPLPPVKTEPSATISPNEVQIPTLRDVAASAGRMEGDEDRRIRGLDSLYAVLGVARALAPVEGRKSMVYFAEAWSLKTSTRTLYDSAVSAANRANVAIHTVDARGLRAQKVTPLGSRTLMDAVDSTIDRFTAEARGGPGAGSTTAGSGAHGDGSPRESGPGATKHAMLQDLEDLEDASAGLGLERLADETGGLAIANTNDLGSGLSRVAEELGLYYEVVYAPAKPVADGSFRRIGVKVSRPGVRVRTRTGYFATPQSSPKLTAYELPLMEALSSAEPKQAFSLRTGLLHFGPKGQDRECLFLADVPLSEVTLEPDLATQTYRGHLSFIGFIKDEAGRVVARLTHDWPLEGPLHERVQARTQSALFRRTLVLSPGPYVVEAAAQDRRNGAISVTRAGFTVPPVEPGLSLGSVVVLQRASAAAKGTAIADPLRVGEVSLFPALGRAFVAGSQPEVPVYVPVFPANGSEPVELKVELRRGATSIVNATPTLPGIDENGRIAWLGGIAAKHLAPGRFDLVVSARQGSTTVEQRTTLEIVPGPNARTEAGGQSSPSSPTRPALDPALQSLLERAGRYVVEYQQSFGNLVAEESYTQRVYGNQLTPSAFPSPPIRFEDGTLQVNTRADVVFVHLASDIPWGVYRDVFEANGVKVRDRDERLAKLFQTPSPSVLDQARRILDESARFNMGPQRTLNIPTLALLFLDPRNQHRFSFRSGGRRRFAGFEGVEVQFEEIDRPGLVSDGSGGTVPASGRFWLEPTSGAVLRSEARYTFEPNRAVGFVATEYRPEPKLGIWVPTEMKERYADIPAAPDRVFFYITEASARYSNLRAFSVEVAEEKVTIPEP